MKKICVTGANGFVGKSVCKILSNSDRIVRGFVRKTNPSLDLNNVEYVEVGDITLKKNWKNLLTGYDCLIHCAGKAHEVKKMDNKEDFIRANVQATRQLAEQAAEAKIKRLIFLSSIKVNGENTDDNKKNLNSNLFKFDDLPNPKDVYAKSKFEAEKVLWEISKKTNLEIVVLRLPLVYGHGVKGNLMRLIKLVKYGIPLPFYLVKNQRSMIGIDNLIDILIQCIEHPQVSGKTFLVSDGQDLSTPELINYISSASNCPSLLFPFPITLLKIFSRIIKRQNEMDRLLGSLQVDSSYLREVLDWTPSVTVKEGIRRMVKNK